MYKGTMRHGMAGRWLASFTLTALLLAGTASAQEEIQAAAPGDWLARYSGARTLGLGDAFVAAADDPLGVLWNPAGLHQLFQNEVRFENARPFGETSLNAFTFAVPARRIPSVGFTVVSLSSGDFERTNELNERLGSFSDGETAFLFSAAEALSQRIALGGNVKVIRQSVETFGASGVGADLGVLVQATPAIRVGASVLNVGGPRLTLRDTQETYPVEVRGGVSFRAFSGRGLVSIELDHREGAATAVHGGSEFWIRPVLALRAGYSAAAPSGGLSIRATPAMSIDYAVTDHELGVTHRVGISYRFGGFFAAADAVPPVFSPIGQRSVTKIELKANAKSEIRDWRLDINDKSNRLVRRFGGQGKPPAHVMWDGKDETGLPLADGSYTCHFAVTDDAGREIEARTRKVEIATEGPRGSVPAVVDVGAGDQ